MALLATPSQDVGRPRVIAGKNPLIWTNVNGLFLDLCKQHYVTMNIYPFPKTNLIESEEIYACHAAGVVAAAHPNWLDELGEVRLEDMSVQWEAGLPQTWMALCYSYLFVAWGCWGALHQ